MSAPRPGLRTADHGFTLVELLVASALFLIVLSVVGGMVASSLAVDRVVRSQTAAANIGQLIARSVESGVREASWISATASGGTELLRVRTATNGATLGWQCQAWYFDGDALYVRTSDLAIAAPTGLNGWTMLGDGLGGRDGGRVFAASGRGVVLSLEVEVADRPPLLIQTTATSRQSSTESAPCTV